MRQAIVRNNMLLVLAAFVAMFAVVFWTVSDYQKKQREIFMHVVLDEVVLAFESYQGSPETFVDIWTTDSDRRITILDQDGIVIADSHDETVGTDKHERPEIKDIGSISTRRSDTIGIELLYVAKQLDDGSIVRVSVPLESQADAYARLIMMLLLGGVGVLLIYYVGLRRLNDHILKPWSAIKEGMKGIKDGRYMVIAPRGPYQEINEIVLEMNEINNELSSHVRAIERYQEQLSKVLDVMRQAVLIFNANEALLYYNTDAKDIFALTDSHINQEAIGFIRPIEIRQALSAVNKGEHPASFDIRIKDRLYEVKAFQVNQKPYDEKDATALILMNEVTQKRAIEQMKRDFVAHASHELKSPLTAIRGYAELIEHQLIDKDEVKHVSSMIVGQTKTMTALVEDMLMLSRLEHLKDGDQSDVPFDGVLRDVIQSLSIMAKQKNITIRTNIKAVVMMADPLDIRTLFKNLIENAIRYSHDQGEIEIHLDIKEQHISFSVADHGIGIAPEHRHRVFERFYRIDKGRIEGGTGLGLAIVKHITMKYEGTIDLQSQLGKGTTIRILLPRHREQ